MARKSTGGGRVKYESYDDIKDARDEDLIKIAGIWAKRANSRLSELEKSGHTKGAYNRYAQAYFKTGGRTNKAGNRFYQGKKFDTRWQLKRHLRELDMFLNAQSSTLGGIKQIQSKRLQKIREGLASRGYTDVKIKDEEAFNAFLDSKMFESLAMYVPSDEIIENIDLMLESGVSIEQVLDEFQLYLARNDIKSPDYDPHYKTFDKIIEEKIQQAKDEKKTTAEVIERASKRGIILK